ncbi:MAG: hypothetical protein NC253_06720 [Ruminococcus sp.]|nr:hypothetical protein [Ruminococcus sp.]MCM1381441.1 hypothetical protein [Muribaculaceae bacterium]MCM1480888.1 hypothetical protein [Muribaculaceae bacterium]
MPENENNSPKKEKGKSFMDVYREVNAREHAEELKREAEAEARRAERERRQRESYEAKLRQERLELLKLKQGVIAEEDVVYEKEPEKHYTLWQKIGNYFYHNKMYIIFGTLIAALAAFLIYDYVSTVRPDAVVMIIASDGEFNYITEDIAALLERYCADNNGDGKVSVRVSYLPADPGEDAASMYYQQADQTKLLAEFQGTEAIMVMGDYESCEVLGITEGVLADLSEYFPNDENVTELGYMLNGTGFAEDIGYDGLADNIFLGFRQPKKGGIMASEKDFQKNFDNAVALWQNYLNGNIVNPPEEE